MAARKKPGTAVVPAGQADTKGAKGKRGKGGRPKAEIDLRLVEKLSQEGLTIEQMARIIGVAESTFHKRMTEDETFSELIKRGQALGIGVATGRLMRAIKRDKLPAIIFYLKTRAGWKETVRHQDAPLTPEEEEEVNAQIEGYLERIARRGGRVAKAPAPEA